MPIRNNHWYDLNDQRKYPLADTASGVDDQGVRLPSSFLADLRLRWPVTYGRHGFLTSYALTPQLVTVLFAAVPELDNPGAPVTLLAGYTGLRRSTASGQAFPLQAFQPGVGGFVVFGGLPDGEYSGRFSSATQSVLAPRAARGVRTPPVRTIGVEGAAASLTRLIQLAAEAPLSVSRETREIGGVQQDDVIVFRLQPSTQPLQLATQPEAVLAAFAGPCGARVGTNSCGDPAPALSFNGVTPDCDGVITLDFRNCALVGTNSVDCGVVLDCGMDMAEVCAPPYLPSLATGELPNEIITDIVIPPVVPPVVDPPPPPVSMSVSEVFGIDLPYCEPFDAMVGTGILPTYFTAVGTSYFEYITDDSPQAAYCVNGHVSISSSAPGSSLSSIVDPPVSSSSSDPVDPPVSSSSALPDLCEVISAIPNLFRWYDASNGVTLSGPGRVSTWQDLSPNAVVLANILSSTYDPYYADGSSADAISGNPTVGLDMIRWLLASPTAPLGGAQGFTVASVFRYRETRLAPNVPNLQGAIWALAGSRVSLGVRAIGSNWVLRLTYRKAAADAVEFVDGPVLSPGDVVVAIGRVSYVSGDTFATLEVNGVTYTGTAPTAGTIASTNQTEFVAYADSFAFTNPVSNKQAMPSDTAEIVVYSRALSSPETTALRDCLLSRYALTPTSMYSFPASIEWRLTSVESYDPTLPVADDQFITCNTPLAPSMLRFKRRGSAVGVPTQLDLETGFFTQVPFLPVPLIKTSEGYNTWEGNWITGSTANTWGASYSATYTSIGGGAPLGVGSTSDDVVSLSSYSGPPGVGESKTATWLLQIYRDPRTAGWVLRGLCTVEEFHDSSLEPDRQLRLYSTKRITDPTIFDVTGSLAMDLPRESADPAAVGIDAEASSDEFPGSRFDGRSVEALLQW